MTGQKPCFPFSLPCSSVFRSPAGWVGARVWASLVTYLKPKQNKGLYQQYENGLSAQTSYADFIARPLPPCRHRSWPGAPQLKQHLGTWHSPPPPCWVSGLRLGQDPLRDICLSISNPLRRCWCTYSIESLSQQAKLSLHSWVKAIAEDGWPLSASVLVACRDPGMSEWRMSWAFMNKRLRHTITEVGWDLWCNPLLKAGPA